MGPGHRYCLRKRRRLDGVHSAAASNRASAGPRALLRELRAARRLVARLDTSGLHARISPEHVNPRFVGELGFTVGEKRREFMLQPGAGAADRFLATIDHPDEAAV